MKIIHNIAKVLLSLIMLIPVIGALGVFPPPTPDLYNTPEAFAFIEVLVEGKYITYINAFIFVVALFLLWTRRETLAALLILPITVNVVAFHAFLDGGLFTGGALMGNVMLLINGYLLWRGCDLLKPLWQKSA